MPNHILHWETKAWGRVLYLPACAESIYGFMEVNAGYQSSRHHHIYKTNAFAVISGSVMVEEWPGDGPLKQTTLGPGQSYSLAAPIVHRFCVLESGVVVELSYVQDGQQVQQDDIVRLDEGGIIPEGSDE